MTITFLVAFGLNWPLGFEEFSIGARLWDVGSHDFVPKDKNGRLSREEAHERINSKAPRAMLDLGADLSDEIEGLRPVELLDPKVFGDVCPVGLAFVVGIDSYERIVTVVSHDIDGFRLRAKQF